MKISVILEFKEQFPFSRNFMITCPRPMLNFLDNSHRGSWDFTDIVAQFIALNMPFLTVISFICAWKIMSEHYLLLVASNNQNNSEN